MRLAAKTLTLGAVMLATLVGGYLAMVSFRQDRELPVGGIRLSVSPGHKGALDLYVPLVDWGARFEAIRLPVRLRVDLRTVDRAALQRLADGGELGLQETRREARDAIAGYLLALIAITTGAAVALGLLTAFAVRHGRGPKLRYTTATAIGTAIAVAITLIVLLPPRGEIDTPQYYAYGADIPRALDAVASVRRSGRALDQELDAQLVGLARLVTEPANRTPTEGRPRITLASDLHNNVLALPILERAAGRGPVFFVGDLTDRGSPLETTLTRRIVRTGRPFVFVSGNHDSDSLQFQLARDGAIVLTEQGRLQADGQYGRVVNTVAGLRVAGYGDPFQRRAREGFADRYRPVPTLQQQQAFADWLRPIRNDVDVILTHEPGLLAIARDEIEQAPPTQPLVFLVGHTHTASLERITPNVTVINGGSVGAGGTGNLAEEDPTEIGLARFIYDRAQPFAPLAADLVFIDPGTGAATARRERLDSTAP